MSGRNRFNPKRKFQNPALEVDERKELSDRVDYTGSPFHKRNPGDFGLTPPSQPHPDKTLCDTAEIFERSTAIEFLQKGIMRGLTSTQWRGDFPQNVWAVTDDGVPLEAQLENAIQGDYHGYPLQETDPWRDAVLKRWKEEDA